MADAALALGDENDVDPLADDASVTPKSSATLPGAEAPLRPCHSMITAG